MARPVPEIALDEAALLIAARAQAGLDMAAELGRLDELAAGCSEPTLAGLCDHLFTELGFSGNRDEYGDPRNSYLNEVLTRRTGIPISLSIVAIEVGRRIGVPLAGVGMPGHFLVGDATDPGVFLDPFGGGRRLDEAGCEAIFRGLGGTGPFSPEYLAPVDARAILNRMLTNLQTIFLPGDFRSAAWVLQFRLAIPGLEPRVRRDLARGLGSLGHFAVAGAELERLAESESLPPEDATRLRQEAIALRARAN